MLVAIRNFIQHHQIVSLEQLTREFCIAAEALDPILHIWVERGVIREANSKRCASRCRTCFSGTVPYYEWIGSRTPLLRGMRC